MTTVDAAIGTATPAAETALTDVGAVDPCATARQYAVPGYTAGGAKATNNVAFCADGRAVMRAILGTTCTVENVGTLVGRSVGCRVGWPVGSLFVGLMVGAALEVLANA